MDTRVQENNYRVDVGDPAQSVYYFETRSEAEHAVEQMAIGGVQAKIKEVSKEAPEHVENKTYEAD